MRINENGIEREMTQEEEAYFQELMNQGIETPPSLEEQIQEVKQQQLDIAEAVVSLYETMTIGADA